VDRCRGEVRDKQDRLWNNKRDLGTNDRGKWVGDKISCSISIGRKCLLLCMW